MVWVKLDDRFVDHEKVASLDPELRPFCIELHVAAMCYCGRELTDGRIPHGQVRRLADFSPHRVEIARVVEELVDVGLWDSYGRGYEIHDWLEFNPSKAEVEERRAKRAAAGTKGAKERWAVPDNVLGYWIGKAGREPNNEDMRSLRTICRTYPASVVTTAIGQVVVQGEPADNFALITTICKAEVQ